MRNPGLFIANSDLGGRGVFTSVPILEDDVIEICPVIVMKKGEIPIIDKTTLYDYYFLWGDDAEQCVIALGYGSLYNHLAPSNADYGMDFEGQTIEIYAVRNIEAGEEVTINYHGDPYDDSPTWFMTDAKDRV
ncbi:MAG: SET domain-containing protein [Saprospiraceae bacterium]|nr:SET domain-containing protein [Saprospiraceae bacterium]